MGVDSEILIKVAKSGFKIEEKAISVKYGGETSTFNPLSHTLRVIWSLLRALQEDRSVSLSRRSSVLMFTGSVVLVGFFFGAEPPSGPSFMFAFSVIGISSLAFLAALSSSRRFRHWAKKTA
jgi:hypothetical protein